MLPDGDALPPLLTIAAVSALLANLLNNLPATLALLPVLAVGGAGPVLAMLIGVNVGPNLTYVGVAGQPALAAGARREAPASARHTAVGLVTVPLTLLTSTLALWAALQI